MGRIDLASRVWWIDVLDTKRNDVKGANTDAKRALYAARREVDGGIMIGRN